MRLVIAFMVLFSLRPTLLIGQGIRGKIVNELGVPLPYATVYVTKLHTGTASNENGDYELELKEGQYQIIFQYLGHRSVQQSIAITGDLLEVNVTLRQEATDLQTIRVSSKDEDPAYTIMRKTISKAKYHTQQLDGYKAISYIKGTGRIKKLPWLIRKKIERELKKEGIDTTTAFVTESVSQITYKRPEQYEEKVISVRKVGNDNNTSPMEFINSSFYNSEINGSISPLSPRAFAYYHFEYLGFFADRGFNVNKIKVIPRSRGDQVFEGIIYIVDEIWAIHSLKLGTYVWGIKFDINQIYEPLQPNVWLPVNQIFDVSGSIFGLGFEYKYFANIKDYQISLNPDLTFEPEVIDEKIEKESARTSDDGYKKQSTEETLAGLSQGKDISRKKLRKVLREYEKQELESNRNDTLEHVLSVENRDVDSMAYKRDSIYWAEIRPIPLSAYEVKGYRLMDSMAIVDSIDVAIKSDSMSVTIGSDGLTAKSSRARSKFRISDFLVGGTYRIGEHLRLGFGPLLTNTHFNTVEGFHTTWRPYLFNRSHKLKWRLEPDVKYSFGRRKLIGGFGSSVSWGKNRSANSLSFFGGTRVEQINEDKPIDPLINDLNSLLFERNYLKVFEKTGGEIILQKKIRDGYHLRLYVSRYEKRQLQDQTDYVIFGSKQRGYSDNTPINSEIGITNFSNYRLSSYGFQLSMTPWLRYRMINNRKSTIDNGSPTISLNYALNSADLDDEKIDFHKMEVRYKQQLKLGIRGDLGLDVRAGSFFNADKTPFPEFKHFPGNKTLLNITDPIGSFRLLEYYKYSTASNYLEVHGYYQFRKLLLTQLPLVRLAGIRENVFVNWLETKGSNHYVELGFGINYIFRFFRIEFVSAYQDLSYREFGIRIGLASNLDAIFN